MAKLAAMNRSPTLESLIVGFLVLSAAFWALERWRPSLPGQRRDGIQTRTDLAYWFFTPLVTRFVTRVSLGAGIRVVAFWNGVTLEEFREIATSRTWASSLPAVVQFPSFSSCRSPRLWSHRIFHGRWLWPFNAIHHSSRTVDWLSSVRLHPVNDAASRIVQVLPLYWMGFNGAVLAAFVPFLTLYALLLHANVSWRYGPPRFVVASPAFIGGITRRKKKAPTRTSRGVALHRPGVRDFLHARRLEHSVSARCTTMCRKDCSGSWRHPFPPGQQLTPRVRTAPPSSALRDDARAMREHEDVVAVLQPDLAGHAADLVLVDCPDRLVCRRHGEQAVEQRELLLARGGGGKLARHEEILGAAVAQVLGLGDPRHQSCSVWRQAAVLGHQPLNQRGLVIGDHVIGPRHAMQDVGNARQIARVSRLQLGQCTLNTRRRYPPPAPDPPTAPAISEVTRLSS